MWCCASAVPYDYMLWCLIIHREKLHHTIFITWVVSIIVVAEALVSVVVRVKSTFPTKLMIWTHRLIVSAVEQLQSCVRSLSYEQKILCHEAASSTLSACRLRQRLMIAQRYFVALGRHLPPDSSRPLTKTSSNGSSGDQRR